MVKKILIPIFAVVLVGLVAFLIWWGVGNKNKLEDIAAGAKIYTKQDVETASNEAYTQAFKDKESYTKLLTEYKNSIEKLTDTISVKEQTISTTQGEIETLTARKVELETALASYDYIEDIATDKLARENELADVNQTIGTKNAEIVSLNNQITSLTSTRSNLQTELATLNRNIATAQTNLTNAQNATQAEIANKQATLRNYDAVIAMLQEYSDMLAIEFTTAPTETTAGVVTYTLANANTDGSDAVWTINVSIDDCQYDVIAVSTCSVAGTGRYTYQNATIDVSLAKLPHTFNLDSNSGISFCTVCGYVPSTNIINNGVCYNQIKSLKISTGYYLISISDVKYIIKCGGFGANFPAASLHYLETYKINSDNTLTQVYGTTTTSFTISDVLNESVSINDVVYNYSDMTLTNNPNTIYLDRFGYEISFNSDTGEFELVSILE